MSTVDVFSAVSDGSADFSTVSAVSATVPGLTCTVTSAVAGDLLYIAATLPLYTGGAASLGKFTFNIAGVAVRTAITYMSFDGNVQVIPLQWKHSIVGGDISGGSVVVTCQWYKYNAGQGTIFAKNDSDGLCTMQVIRVRT